MTTPAPSRRRFGVLLIWCGGVAMVLAGAFTLAWWKLPEWKPRWVIDHSPWAEPAVRAMLHEPSVGTVSYPVMNWGASIGPVLRQKYLDGSPRQRQQVIILAATMLDDLSFYEYSDDISRMFMPLPDGSPLPSSTALALRDDLARLMDAACTDSAASLGETALPLIVALRDPRWTPLLCDWLIEGTSYHKYDDLVLAIAHARDHRAVPRLIPLLALPPGGLDPELLDIPVQQPDPELLSFALRHCLSPNQTLEVTAAGRHPHPHVRAWAASAIPLVGQDSDVRQCLAELLGDAEQAVRLAALEAVIQQGIPDEFHAGFIARLGDEASAVRQMSLRAVIDAGVPPTFRPDFLARLDDPASGLRLLVIDAIGALRINEGGDLLLARLTVEPELSLRISAIEAIGRLEHIDARPVLRQIAVVPTDPMQGAAIVALGTLRDPTDYSLLLTLLSDEDDDIARKARIALGYLTLTLGQQKVVDALWEARSYDGEPAQRPAPVISSPP